MRLVFLRSFTLMVPFGFVLAADTGPSTDPIAVAPNDYRLLLENDQVRVLEQRLPPKGHEARHYQPARVSVSLSDQLIRYGLDGGAEFERESKAGQALWRDAEFHEVTNLSDKPVHDVVVELKHATGDMSASAAWDQLPGAREAQVGGDAKVARLALLGSRDQSGAFVERARYAEGYTEKPHRHNSELHIVVLSGRFCLGFGERFERGAAQCHGAGAFLAIQPNLPHYAWSEGVTVVQIESVGPLSTDYADGSAGGERTGVRAPAAVISTGPSPQPLARPAVSVTPPSEGKITGTPTRAEATGAVLTPTPAPAQAPAPAAIPKSPAPAPGTPRLHARDYDFAYDERGKGSPLLLVHGALTDSRQFAPVMNALSQKHRVIAYSRRFHYPNEMPESGAGSDSYSEHAEDLVALLAVLGAGPIDVLGDGEGADVLMLAASRHPDRFKRLVLVDPQGPEVLGDAKIVKALIEHDHALYADAKRRYKANDPSDALRALLDAWYGGGAFDAATPEQRNIWQQNAATIPIHAADTTGIDCAKASTLSLPVLQLRGANTADTNRAVGRALERCIKQAQAIEIADAGHAVEHDQAGSYVAAIEIFLAQ